MAIFTHFAIGCSLLAFNFVCVAEAWSAESSSSGHVQRLEKKVEDLFAEIESLPIRMSRQNGNIEVRSKFVGDCMVSFAEAKVVDYHPRHFRKFLQDFAAAFPKVNPMARNLIIIERAKDREAVKIILDFPFPLTNRIMIHWEYLKLDRSPDEHMLILSEEGNEDILAKHLTPNDKKNYVLGRTFLCVYWIKPIRKNGKVTGSNIRYAFSGDTGGSIPVFIQNAVGPKTSFDSVNGLIDYVKKRSKPCEQ